MIPELNKIYQGDCLEIMRGWPDKCVDLILTDPPYGIGADSSAFKNGTSGNSHLYGTSWDRAVPQKQVFDEIRRVSKNQVIFGGNYFSEHLSPTKCFVVWDKMTGENSYADCEMAWTSFDKAARLFRKQWIGANAKERGDERLHPTQKPLCLMEWVITMFSESGDLVADPFLGSGTTALAAERLGRRWIGCELNPEYIAIAEKRIDAERSQGRLF